MPSPWQNWFHCNGTLKGNWLRGDERGWRSRQHREHVDGDYKNPPPPMAFVSQFQHSKNLMSAEPVALETFEERKEVCRILGGALRFYGVELAELAVGARHYHTVARFSAAVEKHRAAAEAQAASQIIEDGDGDRMQGDSVPATGMAGLCSAHILKDGRDPLPRYILGKCHSWTTREFKKWLKSQSPGTPLPGTGLFAPRPKCNPIDNEQHFHNSVQYDYDHHLEGAAVWSILFGKPHHPQ